MPRATIKIIKFYEHVINHQHFQNENWYIEDRSNATHYTYIYICYTLHTKKVIGVFRKELKLLLINQYVCYCINLAQI